MTKDLTQGSPQIDSKEAAAKALTARFEAFRESGPTHLDQIHAWLREALYLSSEDIFGIKCRPVQDEASYNYITYLSSSGTPCINVLFDFVFQPCGDKTRKIPPVLKLCKLLGYVYPAQARGLQAKNEVGVSMQLFLNDWPMLREQALQSTLYEMITLDNNDEARDDIARTTLQYCYPEIAYPVFRQLAELGNFGTDIDALRVWLAANAQAGTVAEVYLPSSGLYR